MREENFLKHTILFFILKAIIGFVENNFILGFIERNINAKD